MSKLKPKLKGEELARCHELGVVVWTDPKPPIRVPVEQEDEQYCLVGTPYARVGRRLSSGVLG